MCQLCRDQRCLAGVIGDRASCGAIESCSQWITQVRETRSFAFQSLLHCSDPLCQRLVRRAIRRLTDEHLPASRGPVTSKVKKRAVLCWTEKIQIDKVRDYVILDNDGVTIDEGVRNWRGSWIR